MKENQPTIYEWKRLYELASELQNLAPWQWMEETMIFGVENPDTKEIGFVSPMGILSEHFAVGVYLGADAFYDFWDFQRAGVEAEPFALFEIPQLQVSFEDREMLEKKDRDTIKKLDLKFRGRQSYPIFRSIRPGFLPWFINSGEARILIYAIEQMLEVAPRVKENPAILGDESGAENRTVLTRFAKQHNGKHLWSEEFREIPLNAKNFNVDFPQASYDKIKDLPQAKDFVVEIGLFYSEALITGNGKRPYIPKMLLLTDALQGLIVGFKLIQPKENYQENYREIATEVLRSLEKLDARPYEIRVDGDLLFNMLRNFTQNLNISLRQIDDLPALEAARSGISEFMRG